MPFPLTIGIGGAHSAVGKTTLAAALLKKLTKKNKSYRTDKSYRTYRWGAIKYTKTPFYSSVVDDRPVLAQKGKDTAMMLEAGAEEVLWVRSPAGGLGEVLPLALERLSHLDGILIEGNSAIEFLKPDIVIFLGGTCLESFKPSALVVMKLADIFVVRERGGAEALRKAFEFSHARISTPILYISRFHGREIKALTDCVEEISMRKNIEKLLKEKAVDGKIACGLARKIAEELGVPYKEVGAAADELNIKIKNCELGCF